MFRGSEFMPLIRKNATGVVEMRYRYLRLSNLLAPGLSGMWLQDNYNDLYMSTLI